MVDAGSLGFPPRPSSGHFHSLTLNPSPIRWAREMLQRQPVQNASEPLAVPSFVCQSEFPAYASGCIDRGARIEPGGATPG